ncbi:MAG: PAS domain-containing sensor histidine kinase [Tepidiformaceae bacterium]
MKLPPFEAITTASDEDQARLLLDAITDYAIFVLDPDGVVTSWNTGAERLKGYSASEIIGRHFSAFYSESDRAEGRPHRILEVARLQGRVEDEGWRVRKDGSTFWANVIITTLRHPDGSIAGFAKITRDMTARREAEAALFESQQHFRMLVEAARDYAMYMLSPEGIVISWNSAAQRLTRYTDEEILGRHFSMFYAPEDARAGKPQLDLELALAEGRHEEEGWRIRKGGSTFWASCVVTPVRDTQDRLVGFAQIARDMTERTRAREELQLSEQRNRDLEAESFAKDEFLGVVSHEFRTPLTVLYGGTRLLVQQDGQLNETDRVALIHTMATEAARLKSLMESIFLLVNPSPTLQLSRVSIKEQATLAAADFRQVAPAREVQLRMPARDANVEVEIPLFQRVLLNLLTNADKYSPSLKPIELAVSEEDGVLVIEVRDRGLGVDPAELGLIFNSFYRSVSTSKISGKGIGLAVCRRVIHLFGGSIEARARSGGGLILRVMLPIAT